MINKAVNSAYISHLKYETRKRWLDLYFALWSISHRKSFQGALFRSPKSIWHFSFFYRRIRCYFRVVHIRKTFKANIWQRHWDNTVYTICQCNSTLQLKHFTLRSVTGLYFCVHLEASEPVQRTISTYEVHLQSSWWRCLHIQQTLAFI